MKKVLITKKILSVVSRQSGLSIRFSAHVGFDAQGNLKCHKVRFFDNPTKASIARVSVILNSPYTHKPKGMALDSQWSFLYNDGAMEISNRWVIK